MANNEELHSANGDSIAGPYPEGFDKAIFGMGCFWGAERIFWNLPGVWETAVGYAGGHIEQPSYELVCSGRTGHNEVVLVVFDPKIISYESLLTAFWESHDPTQGMRQGNDRGTQYRSGIYCFNDAQLEAAEASRTRYQVPLSAAGYGAITTEIIGGAEPVFYFAESYHQQYLAHNPNGYCGIGGTGVACQVGVL